MAKKKKSKDDSEDLSADDLGVTPKQSQPAEVEEKKGSEKSQKKQEKEAPTPAPVIKKERPLPTESDFIQSETNVGMVGHVDHGKTTLVKALSGMWTERYADEINRGITIKLGYAETEMVQCPKCNKIYTMNVANSLRQSKKQEKGTCPEDGEKLKFKRRISFVDAPGHEILMATMLSGASLMDGAILLVSANESCPQPQTREHLAALGIAKIENIIIVQNKVDAVGKQRAFEHYKQIKAFVKGTIAENAPIIPVSAVFNANVDIVSEKIEEVIPSPELDEDSDFLFNIARSFDVNKPGSEIHELRGGVVGGSIVSGHISVGEQVEIRPGLKGKDSKYRPVITTIRSIFEGSHSLSSARPGGLIAVGTDLDPAMTRTDQLIGNILGRPETLPPVLYSVDIEVHLLDKVLGAEEELAVEPLKKGEVLMVVVSTMTSAGVLEKFSKADIVTLSLKRPICAVKGSITAISRRINGRFRLIGYGYLQ